MTLKGFMEEMRIELYFERKWDKDTQKVEIYEKELEQSM